MLERYVGRGATGNEQQVLKRRRMERGNTCTMYIPLNITSLGVEIMFNVFNDKFWHEIILH